MPHKDSDVRRQYAKEYHQLHKERRKKLLLKNWEMFPWLKTLKSINSRCSNVGHHYFKKGIKNYLTEDDIKYLWFRDSADLLSRPSIHRINRNAHYSLGNCCFIELSKHNK